MFSFGLFTYIKIAGALLIAGTLAFFIWNYHHRAAVIEQLKVENANLVLEKDVLVKENKALQEFTAQKTVIQRRVIYVQKDVDQAIDSGDVARVIDMFHKLRGPDQIQPAPNGGTGRAKPALVRPAKSGLN